MPTLLLRLAAPLQAWGTSSQFEIRSTDMYPSKSGVIGLLASALGRSRAADISDLASLKIGIRADQEGTIICDYHTIMHKKGDQELRYRYCKDRDKIAYVTRRYYLADAAFLVGIESDDRKQLETYAYAIEHPCHPLFLGRRSCPPAEAEGLVIGIRDTGLRNALANEPWIAADWYKKRKSGAPFTLRMIMDTDAGEKADAVTSDCPISFNTKKRLYTARTLRMEITEAKKA